MQLGLKVLLRKICLECSVLLVQIGIVLTFKEVEVMLTHLALVTGTYLVAHLSQISASMTMNASLLRDCITLTIEFFDFLYL